MSASRLRLLLPRLHLNRPVAFPAAPPQPPRQRPEAGDFGRFLLDRGVIDLQGLLQGLAARDARGGDLGTLLLARGLARDPELTRARAAWHGLALIDPVLDAPDARLIEPLGTAFCLREGLLPWRSIGGVTLVLTHRAEEMLHHRAPLEALFGRVSFALAPRDRIEAAIRTARCGGMRRAAEARTPALQSCRSLPAQPRGRGLAALAVALGAAALLLPGGLLVPATALALLVMLLSVGLKTAALAAALRRSPAPAEPPVAIARLPVVSVIVPLYREADIAPRLVRRLGRIDYPRELLDFILAVEQDDAQTRATLAGLGLPPWMRMVTVPDGALKTKPRALNYALDFCRGSIVGVYDAEDAPDPRQIHAVVRRFHQRGPQVACLQGILDFYNPQSNWLARCFTIEYASWFRVILPGLERLGLPIPLGGTTLFFRRAALEALGAWDAHNVTEDADLGIRLCRQGYRTELIDSVTGEEANCRTIPWVRQRSRWIKGYVMTWRVHMRDPRALWRDLGPRGFAGFQILILGSALHALMAPVLLSVWGLSLGLPHPIAAILPWPAVLTMLGLFLLAAALNLTLGAVALRRAGHPVHPLWLVTLGLYHPLASLAACKALWEVARRPFYWDKTRHGEFDALTAR